MVWGWHYDDGPGDYARALLERTGDADLFRGWHAREELRRLLLSKRIELHDLGGGHNVDLSLDSEAAGRLSPASGLDERVAWHLAQNLLPAVPASMVSVCVKAIQAARLGSDSVQIDLPASVWFTPGDERIRRSASAEEIIRQHSLSRFILRGPQLRRAVDRAWDVGDALAAWELANLGKWELPSPIPSWPEFVTVLLVGRNFLEPGEEDDPSERDQIRSWWGPDGWRRGYNAGWWDGRTVRLMSLPDPRAAREQPTQTEGQSLPAATTSAESRSRAASPADKDDSAETAAICDWLATISRGDSADPSAFLPSGWKQLIEAIWRPDDLGWTEDLIRGSLGQGSFPGKHPTGVADLNALLARVLLAQGKDQEALDALKPLRAVVWGPLLPGLPYWWIQIRGLAEGRLALERGERTEALRCFMNAVRPPQPGRYSDPDYVLQGLLELAALNSTGLDGAPSREEWARIALAVADGLDRWSEARGWTPPDGYDAETIDSLNAILAARTVEWESATAPHLRIGLKGISWRDELDYLSEMLDELVTTYAYNRFVEPRPFIEEIDRLWDPADLTGNRLRVTEHLSDAYDHRDAAPSADPIGRSTPWHREPMAVLQLEALLARALSAQGDVAAARFAAARAFGAHASPPGWVVQLEALTTGRLSTCLGETEAAFDSFWLAVRHWMAGKQTDLDLLLETFCELAMLGYISPRHPDPAQWAERVTAMTDDRPDDEWRPGSWYASQFRAPVGYVLGASRLSPDERVMGLDALLPKLLRSQLRAAERPDAAQRETVDVSEALAVGRELNLDVAHRAWALWDRLRMPSPRPSGPAPRP